MMDIQIKRVYENPSPQDGYRVLVDRLWPRGIRKDQPHIDLWLKKIAPSTELRKWFAHDPQKWQEFKQRYSAELDQHHATLRELIQNTHDSKLTLLYASKNEQQNNALVVQEYLLHHFS